MVTRVRGRRGPQLGRQLHSVLLHHMQRFTYSPAGALRWKRDLAEYAEWARALRVPLLSDRFQELQARPAHCQRPPLKSVLKSRVKPWGLKVCRRRGGTVLTAPCPIRRRVQTLHPPFWRERATKHLSRVSFY